MDVVKEIAEFGISEELVRAVLEQYGDEEDFFERAEDSCDASGGVCGFIYYTDTLKFTEKNFALIIRHATELAEGIGYDDIFIMVSQFGCINLTPQEVAEAMYNPESENHTEVYNALAWFALEEVANAAVTAKEA